MEGAKEMDEARRILLVDDDQVFARYFSKQLAAYGAVRIAGTKGGALKELADGLPWRAIIIDLCLPDGPGMDVVLEAKRNHPKVPTMLITGNVDLRPANTVYAIGVDYLEKPIDAICLERFMCSKEPLCERIDRQARVWRERDELTDSEEDILRRAASGESRDAIASARGSTVPTVKRQIWSLLQKTADESLHAAVERLIREAVA